jgi:hypothetical protein
MVGLWAIFANGQTYASKFSTVIRTTRHAGIDSTTARAVNTTGAEPLPWHIARAKIDFRERGAGIGLKERMSGSRDESGSLYG